MMAWGVDCSVWDDSVDYAARKLHGPNEVPDENFVMTTWHTNDTLEQVFWYAQFCGNFGYDDQVLDLTLILDIGETWRERELCALFAGSHDLPDRES